MSEERALIPIGIVAPLVTVDEAVKAWQQYLELLDKLLDASDYQIISGRKFRKKSGWRKLARAFNITDEIVEKNILRDGNGRITEAEFLVRAMAPNGRVAHGWGSCAIHERGHEEDRKNRRGEITCPGPCDGRKHFSNVDHDVPATAHTRAKNRAISDLIGAGEVSAEEMGTPEHEARADERPAPRKAEPKPAPPRQRRDPDDVFTEEQQTQAFDLLNSEAESRGMQDGDDYNTILQTFQAGPLTRRRLAEALSLIRAWAPSPAEPGDAGQEELEI